MAFPETFGHLDYDYSIPLSMTHDHFKDLTNLTITVICIYIFPSVLVYIFK